MCSTNTPVGIKRQLFVPMFTPVLDCCDCYVPVLLRLLCSMYCCDCYILCTAMFLYVPCLTDLMSCLSDRAPTNSACFCLSQCCQSHKLANSVARFWLNNLRTKNTPNLQIGLFKIEWHPKWTKKNLKHSFSMKFYKFSTNQIVLSWQTFYQAMYILKVTSLDINWHKKCSIWGI